MSEYKKIIDIPPPEERFSIFEFSAREAHSYKWLESEKSGCDLGDQAIADWYKQYWRIFCRERYIEHLSAVRFWIELDSGDYGLLKYRFSKNDELLDTIVNIFKEGGENLDVVNYALENDIPLEDVIKLLEILDINARRIAPTVEITEKQFVEGIRASHHPRALIVDDDTGTRELLQKIVGDTGLECITAISGEEALIEVQSRRFDLFIIDIMLPGKHGAEVAWYLRRHGVKDPIIAISAALDTWNADDLHDCGFSEVMSKPLNLNRLREISQQVHMRITSEVE